MTNEKQRGISGLGITRGVVAGVLLMLYATQATAGGVLSYSATNFTARWQNDGGFSALQNAVTVTLGSGQTNNFAPGISNLDYVALGWVTVSNLPSGLTALVQYSKTNQVTIGLNGFHTPNNISQNISNLFFVFTDNAFSNNSPGAASSILGYNGTNQLSVCFLAPQSNWYVNVNSGYDTQGTGANQGNGSSSYPWKSITNAIAHAQANANDVINIAAGTYWVTNQPAISTAGKNLTFSGTNAALTIIQASATPGTATNALFAWSSTASSQFQNLTLQNGRSANGGGAISTSAAGDLTVTNCFFLNNISTNKYSGAILHSQAGTQYYLTLIGCTFTNNLATNTVNGVGGALYTWSDIITISNCVFVGNSANGNGGAIYAYADGYSLVNSVMINNTSLNGNGGAISQATSGPGYGAYLYGCTIASNNAAVGGGGINGTGPMMVTNSTFFGNVTTNGCGGAVSGSTLNNNFYNSTLCGNSALTGGAVRSWGACLFYSCIVASNTATTGIAPDVSEYAGNAAVCTNSLIGNTNGIAAASTMVGASATATNGYGNYGGSTATLANPGIQPLANNGGLVPTCALLPSSLAIHHGGNLLGLLYDARGPGYLRSNALGQTDMGAYDFSADLPSFAYSYTTFGGNTAGVITTTNTIALLSPLGLDTFNGGVGTNFVTAGWLTVANVPLGLTVTATEVNSTNLSVTMTGTASALTMVTNMTFTFTSNALVTTTSVSNNFSSIVNSSVSNLYVVFDSVNNTPALLYSGTAFYGSAPLNNGSISNTITITLTNTEFVGNMGDDFIALSRVHVSNLPAGLTATAILNNPDVFPQTLTVSLNGNATAHYSPNDVANLTFAFQNSAFQFVPASSVNNATVSNLQILFVNPVLSYINKAFSASWRNDGTIGTPSNSVVATLIGDTFNGVVGANLYASGQVTAQNVPSGLTPVVTMQSSTGVVISLTGAASPHTSAQNVNNLGFTYQNNAFVGILANGQSASLVTNYNESDLSVTFLSQNQSNWYVNGSTGSEANNGTSAATPFKSITNAIAHAQSSANDVINIAAGTYWITNQPAVSVSKVLTFAGTNAAVTIIQASATPGTATNGLFTYSSAASSIYQNLTLQNGRSSNSGGAIMGNASIDDLIVSNCVFINNSTTNGNGGAICHAENSIPNAAFLMLIGCTFSNNAATNSASQVGGAVYAYNETFTISNCVFVGNSASSGGGAVDVGGGSAAYPPLSVVNTVMMNNSTTNGNGGAINNSASGEGIGLYGCTFATNMASLLGGAIRTGGPLFATNSTFYGNVTTNGSGGAYNNLSVYNSPFYNCTVVGNSAATGGAFYAYGSVQLYSTIVASNTVTGGVAANGPDIYQSFGSASPTIATNSLIGITNGIGSASTLVGATATTTNSSGNYGGSTATLANPGIQPLANNGGMVPTCALLPGSLAIGTGYNPLGLLYDARGVGYSRTNKVTGLTDMGAFELWQPPLGAKGTTLLFW